MPASLQAACQLGPTARHISTLQDQIVYNRESDEPPRKQVLDRKVVETLNTMLQGVVTNGTGKAAQLDYTHSAGKTGTSSNYRDAWFIGSPGSTSPEFGWQ
jgi:penicillin-binding protein 1A